MTVLVCAYERKVEQSVESLVSIEIHMVASTLTPDHNSISSHDRYIDVFRSPIHNGSRRR